MNWLDAVEDIVQRYRGQTGGTAAAPQDPHSDFQQVARTAPSEVVSNGISQMFRSDQTPPFAQMVSSLFSQSDPNQRAGLLERLLGSLVPAAATLVPGLAGQNPSQLSPAQVQQVAVEAEKKDPSVVDKVSSFYAQHPGVVQAAGGLALTIALQHMMKRR